MSKKKKTTDEKLTDEVATTDIQPGSFVTRVLFRPRILLLLAIVASSVVLGSRIRRWLPDLSQREEYQFSSAQIEITPPPRWVPLELVEQVVQNANLPQTLNMLDDSLNETIAKAFEQHPWVAKVVSVERLVPSRVKVELEFRKPAGMVDVKQGLYPIDADGILLPPTDFSTGDAKRFPLILDVQSTPQGPAGTSWGDATVAGAARLANVLAPYWKQFGLEAIHAPRQTTANTTIEQMVFELSTTGGSRIVWGSPPGSAHPGELSAELKIGRLEQYLADFGKFDQPHGPYQIDIRHWQEISRRPLAAKRNTNPRR